MLLDLLLPTACLICSKPPKAICSKCLLLLTPKISFHSFGDLNGFSFLEYDENFSKVILGIKDHGITSAVDPLIGNFAQLWPTNCQYLSLVPIPSSPANDLKRGYSHTKLLARSLVSKVPSLRLADLLISKKSRLDQSKLNLEQRKSNMAEAFQVRTRFAGQQVLLFDDILTTGATILAAQHALTKAGVQIAGYCVVARVGPIKL